MTAERMTLPLGVCRTEGARTLIEKGVPRAAQKTRVARH